MAGKENIWTCLFFVGVVVGLPSYMTEPFRKLGLRFWILPFAYGLLLMQNSHLSVLRQATPQSLERVASWKPRHIFVTCSVYNSAAMYSLKKGRLRIFSDFLTFESYRKVAWRAREDGWPCEALRCSTAPAVCCGTGECTGRSILLPEVNTSLNFRRSVEHSFGFRSMSEHRQVRVCGESR